MVETGIAYVTGRHTWSDVAKRLASCAQRNGATILTITIVAVDGLPAHWTRPIVTPIEPASRRDEFIEMLNALPGDGKDNR